MFQSLIAGIAYRMGIWERYFGIRSHNRRHFARAEEHFSRAIRNRTDYLHAYLERGILRWRELDDYMGAIEDFNQVLGMQPYHQKALICRSMAYWRGGNYVAAIDDLERVIEINPESQFARNARTQLTSLYLVASELPAIQKRLTSGNNP
jgi:tetratricopeptide (TPR) repeat protein